MRVIFDGGQGGNHGCFHPPYMHLKLKLRIGKGGHLRCYNPEGRWRKDDRILCANCPRKEGRAGHVPTGS